MVEKNSGGKDVTRITHREWTHRGIAGEAIVFRQWWIGMSQTLIGQAETIKFIGERGRWRNSELHKEEEEEEEEEAVRVPVRPKTPETYC
jgi:hypothetical protein